MAISDLLWACPACGTDRGLRSDRGTTACHACGTRFQRVDGASIRAEPRDGEAETLSPAQWLRRLPDPASLLQDAAPDRDPGDDPDLDAVPMAGPDAGPVAGPSDAPVRSARVVAKFVVREEVVRDGDRYLNRIEIYGRKEEGTLTLTRDRLIYTPTDTGRGTGGEADRGAGTGKRTAGGEGVGERAGAGAEWPFDDLMAVQASSRKLQLNGRGVPLASFAFLDDSSFLWENLVMAAIRLHYRQAGRGEVVEFQPRIRVG